MHNNAEAEEYDDESPEQRPRWSRFWSMLTRGHNEEEGYEEEDYEDGEDHGPVARVPAPGRASGGSVSPLRRGATGSTLRLETVRRTHVSVRRTVQSFEDVRKAVDGLRDGIQQIVNLEQTPADMSERLIDFMNGATYAIDGSVEKIGEQVYLFTPQNVTIDIEEKTTFAAGSKTPFFDKD